MKANYIKLLCVCCKNTSPHPSSQSVENEHKKDLTPMDPVGRGRRLRGVRVGLLKQRLITLLHFLREKK